MKPFAGDCHCGSVTIQLPKLPLYVLQCNCSLCSKTGWIGSYWSANEVEIEDAQQTLVSYASGPKTIEVWHCKTCGCTTHWTERSEEQNKMGVNMRMFKTALWEDIEIKHVDGASR